MKRALCYANQHLGRRRIFFAAQKFARETHASGLTLLKSTLDTDRGRTTYWPEQKQPANEKY